MMLPRKLVSRLDLLINPRFVFQVWLVSCRRLPGAEFGALYFFLQLCLLLAKQLQLSSIFVVAACKLRYHRLCVATSIVRYFDRRVIRSLECMSATGMPHHLNFVQGIGVGHAWQKHGTQCQVSLSCEVNGLFLSLPISMPFRRHIGIKHTCRLICLQGREVCFDV